MESITINDKSYLLRSLSYDRVMTDKVHVVFDVVGENEQVSVDVPIDDVFKGAPFVAGHLISYVTMTAVQKPVELMRAENNYILYMRSLGLSDKAGTTEVAAYVEQLMLSDPMAGTQVALKSLALINNVTQNGGRWATIEWHPEIVEG